MITSIGRLMLQFKWAKSLSWFDRTKTAKHHIIFTIGIAEYTASTNSMRALRIIIGPLSIMIGWLTPD